MMPRSAPLGRRYTFEQWTLDCDRGTLTSADGEIALRPKSYDALRFLIENAGRLVSRVAIPDAARAVIAPLPA